MRIHNVTPLSPKRRRVLALALLCLCATQALAQTSLVVGIVVDERGEPVAGARVSSGGDTLLAVTGADGEFSFETEGVTEATLRVSAEGFAAASVAWRAEMLGRPVRVVLAPAPLDERVTVTATRTETRLGETAASVAVLPRDALEATAAARLDDALRQVAGFQLFRRAGSRTANPTTQGVSLRGTGASGASRAAVLADGVPLNDPFGGWVYWGRVPRESVAAVEVLRGGASHLYGGGALGGAVQILTRRPEERASLSLELSYGNQRTPAASVYASARRGAWSASVAGELFRTDGYVLVDGRERGAVDTPAGVRTSSGVLTVGRTLSGGGRLFARGSLFGERRANGTTLQTNATRIGELSAGADLTGAHAGSFNLRAYGSRQSYDQTFTAAAADRGTEQLTRAQRVPAQNAGLSAQWSRTFGAAGTLAAGLDAREARGASDETAYAAGRATSLVGAGGRERTAGLFVQGLASVGRRAVVTGGARFDRWRNYRASTATLPLTRVAPVAVNEFPDRTESAFSPRLSLLYRTGVRVSFAASAYRAFRQPTLNELYRSFRVGDALTLSNENLRAERLTGGEAGANFNARDGRLTARAAVFWADVTRAVANVTISVAPGLITRRRENLGRTRARGLEVEWEARLARGWTLSGGYLLADSRVARFPPAPALEGLRVPQVPRHLLTFQARYANGRGLTLAAQARASGLQFDDDQNRLPLAAYFTLDLFAARRLRRGVAVFAAAENLGPRTETGRTPVLTLGPPPLVRAGLRLRL